MNQKYRICLILVFFIVQMACSVPIAQNAANTPTATVANTPTPKETGAPEPTLTVPVLTPPVAETPSTGPFSLDMLKNFSYRVEDFNVQADLVDGVYLGDMIQARLVEPAAFGDLNGDGKQDAAVVLAIKSGGTGTFFDLIAVLDNAGTPEQVGFTTIGDRQIVKNLQIADGRIVLDYLTQGLNDPLCCPGEHRLRSYLLENGLLRLASEQVLDSPDAQATPLPNVILIDQPEELERITIPQEVGGRLSQVPPERKLDYYVTDLSGTLLAQGEIPLEGQPGGQGAFSFQFSLDLISPGLYQVEVVDSANGILRGRSVVVLLGQ